MVDAAFILDLLEMQDTVPPVSRTIHLCFFGYEVFICFVCRILLDSFIAVSVYLHVTCVEEKIFLYGLFLANVGILGCKVWFNTLCVATGPKQKGRQTDYT